MPSTNKGLKILIRKNKLNDKEWLDLIEARRQLILPHLDSFTLPELASVPCLRSEISFTHELRFDKPTLTGDNRFSLKIQGIFRKQPYSAIKRISNSGYQASPGGVSCPDGTMLVWGLTRSGLWILVTIDFVGEAGYKDRGYERATTVEIVESDLSTIVAKTKEEPWQMWNELGRAIKGWRERRKSLYHEALALAQMVETEELALSLVSVPEK